MLGTNEIVQTFKAVSVDYSTLYTMHFENGCDVTWYQILSMTAMRLLLLIHGKI